MDESEFFPPQGSDAEEFFRDMARKLEERYESLDSAERRVFLTELAVLTGSNLLQIKALSVHGLVDWGATLERLGMSAATARRYMSLARFARRAPALFDRLKMLDRRELYRLARLGPEMTAELYPEASGESGDGGRHE